MASKRIMKEITAIKTELEKENSKIPFVKDIKQKQQNSLFQWYILLVVQNCPSSPYNGGHFKIEVTFPTDYPFKPPKILFITPILHPGVDQGKICLDILSTDFNPAITVLNILIQIESLLRDPDGQINTQLKDLMNNDREAFNEKVSSHVKKYASEGSL